jgi:hypothetical protein
MSIRLYDGASWNNQKGLQVYNGSAWAKSKQGWIYNGTAWSMFYPEYPLNSVLPSISGSATQGSILTAAVGTWSTLDAYTDSGTLSYSYQWKSAGVNVGTNSNQYTSQLSDVGKAITCVVTASNLRGPTSATSSNSITIQSAVPSPPTGVVITDTTATPGAPSGVTVTPLSQPSGQTEANVSWNAATGTFTLYEGQSNNGFLVNVNSSTRTASITGGTPGTSVTASIRAGNTSGSITISWNASANATSYDVYLYNITDGTSSGPFNTSLTSYNMAVTTNKTYQAQVYAKNAAGSSATTGNSSNTTISTKYSGYAQGSSTFNSRIIPSISGLTASSVTNSSALLSWSQSNQAEYRVVGYTGWLSGSNTSYNLTGLSASTGYSVTVEIRSTTLNTASASTSFTTTATPIIPVIGSFTVTNSGSLTYLNWTITGGNQASAVLTASPATGGAGGGSSFNITSSTDRQKYVGTATTGTTYTFGITVTSTTGHTASTSTTYTYGTALPSVPGTPTLTYQSANNTPTTWGYSATWGASTGSGTIQYQLSATGSSGGTATLGLYSTNSATFNLSRNDTTWQIKARATNDGGTTFTQYSDLSNSA